MAAEGGEGGSSGSQSPGLGDMWTNGCRGSPDWEGDVESWTGSEGTSSSEQCEHYGESRALSVVEQDRPSSGSVSLKCGLADALQFPKVDLAGAVCLFLATEASSVRRMCGGTVPDHHGHSPWVQVELFASTFFYCQMR